MAPWFITSSFVAFHIVSACLFIYLLFTGEIVFAICLTCFNFVFFYTAVDFFNQVNILYGTLTEFCTPVNCPTMSAGSKYGS